MLIPLTVLIATPNVPAGLQEKINDSVEQGVEWLQEQQLRDGSWPMEANPVYGGGTSDPDQMKFGISALCLLALLESDVPTKHDSITRGFQYLLANPDKAWYSYDMSTFLMLAHSFYRHKEEERRKAEPASRWEKDKTKYEVRKEMAVVIDSFVKRILKLQMPSGGWRYMPGIVNVKDANHPDASSTQFALLGLHAAHELGFKSSVKIYQKATKCLLSMQQEDGPSIYREAPGQPRATDEDSYVPIAKDKARGWPYIHKSKSPAALRVTGSMTTVGICGLIVCKAHLSAGKSTFFRRNKEKIDQAIYDGFAWLAHNWTVQNNPNGHRSHYYYLYGLERVGLLGGFDYIGEHNWYREGAEYLVKAQQKVGAWSDPTEINPKELMGTSFALLFLKQGTVPVLSGQPKRHSSD